MGTSRERFMRLALLNQEPLRFPPKITYGKALKRMPLTANHFLQMESYHVPQDYDENERVSPKQNARASAREPDPEDEPLSEYELEAVYGYNGVGLISTSSSPVTKLPKRTSDPCVSNIDFSPHRRKVEKRTKRAIMWSPKKKGRRSVASRNTPQKPGKMPPTTCRIPTTKVKKASAWGNDRSYVPGVGKTYTNKSAPNPRARRLPTAGLVLIHSPVTDKFPSRSAAPSSAEPMDPIVNSSQTVVAPESSTSDDHVDVNKLPLRSIKDSLKTPKFTHKSVVALRTKKGVGETFFQTKRTDRAIGDGFDISELHVNHREATWSKRRGRSTRKKALLLGFGALTVRTGKLPDVDFGTHSADVKSEALSICHGVDIPSYQAISTKPTTSDDLAASGASRPVRFTGKVLNDMIMANLSSVSAPERVYTPSSDSGSDEEIENEDEEAVTESASASDDRDYDHQEDEATESHRSSSGSRGARKNEFRLQISFEEFHRPAKDLSPMPSEPLVSQGVTFDFRRRGTAGLGPKTEFDKQRFMGLDELRSGNVASTDEQYITIATSEDAICNDADLLDNVDSPQLKSGPSIYQTPPRVEEPGHSKFVNYLYQPHSILRNGSRAIFQNTHTQVVHTALNTRRNSRPTAEESRSFSKHYSPNPHPSPVHTATSQRRNTEIHTGTSGYFTSATGMLQEPRTEHTTPRIIKSQRTSDRHLSSHFGLEPDKTVLVPDTDGCIQESLTAVRETSLDPPDYTDSGHSYLLKCNAEVEPASSLPKMPKDLRSLIRAAS